MNLLSESDVESLVKQEYSNSLVACQGITVECGMNSSCVMNYSYNTIDDEKEAYAGRDWLWIELSAIARLGCGM